MRLGDLLDVSELNSLITDRYIVRRNHTTLPLTILNYSNECMFQGFWPETVQQCRGLIVETFNNSRDILPESPIISRPFHKFFNLNQEGHPETFELNLPAVEPTITEKMDGWFGILWRYTIHDGQTHYGIASRGSFESPGAVFGTGKLAKLIKYGAIDEFPAGYTPIFEIIFKAGKIVVDYPFEGLVLLGCVNNETGEELPYDYLQAVWAKIAGYSADNRPWIRLVKAHRMSVGECLASPNTNFEGFVLSYPRPGTWPVKVKVKLEDYKRLHKLITGVTPQQLWRTLHDPLAPWVGGEVPDHFRQWAVKWRDELYAEYHNRLTKSLLGYEWAVDRHGRLTQEMKEDKQARKTVFESLKYNFPDQATIILTLLDGRIYEAHQAIWNSIRPVGRESDTFYREGQGE